MNPTPLRRCSACGRVICICQCPIPIWQLVAIAHAASDVLALAKWGIYQAARRFL